MENKIKENCCFFLLKEISEWQLNNSESKISLPPLQRGFVWKVNQIESLWDSLLRGFPIGSLLLSKGNDGKLDLLDGQQRATTIALGFYDPWNDVEKRIGSLKSNPIVWIDLFESEKKESETKKFTIRVVTKSHPWGYQIKYNEIESAPRLSSNDRSDALEILKLINPDYKYTKFPPTKIFPYDAQLPVPLCFVLKAIDEGKQNWKKYLLDLCQKNLDVELRTKYFEKEQKYFEKLKAIDFNSEYLKHIYKSVNSLNEINIPGIFVPEKTLFEDDGETTDPTLFIRFNRGGTRIEGEELIYSIYKAAFSTSKDLIENIQADYIPPSRIITLVSRLIISEIDNGFPSSLNPAQFKKKIREETFKNKLKEFIGQKDESRAEKIFSKAIEILRSEDDINIPAFLVKTILNNNPELFLLLLKWLQLNYTKTIIDEEKKLIIANITALSFFGSDNSRYVREVWSDLNDDNFWTSQNLKRKFKDLTDFIMFPLQPETLKEFLLTQIVGNKKSRNSLYPIAESDIINDYKKLINATTAKDDAYAINGIWNFVDRLYSCRLLVLFAQRVYINKNFGDFNQMESLEDTNTPWDWDHIYPSEWVYNAKNIDPKIRDWNSCIGNQRALSFSENRSDSNRKSPKIKVEEDDGQSFFKDDVEFWDQIGERIYDEGKVYLHSEAVIRRLVNIYKDWYLTLNLGDLFNYEDKTS